MRDEKDPGTLEMPLAKKRGRPTKFSTGPLSAAERARRYREGVRNESRQVVPTIVLEAEGEPLRDSALLDALSKAVSTGDRRGIHEICGFLCERYPR